MPNWVFNTLEIEKGNEEYLFNDKKFTFEALIPMPEELKRTISGGVIGECMAYAYLKEHTKEEFLDKCNYYRPGVLKRSMTKEEMLNALKERVGDNPVMFNDETHHEKKADENGREHYYVVEENYGHTIEEIGKYYLGLEEKYGCSDWYNWACEHWGTKWDACEAEISDDGDKYSIRFDTAWGCPDLWVEELTKRGIDFNLYYEGEEGWRGMFVSRGGTLTDVALPGFEDEDYDEEKMEEVDDVLWNHFGFDLSLNADYLLKHIPDASIVEKKVFKVKDSVQELKADKSSKGKDIERG